jgi:thioredoxin-related protein
MIGAVDCTEASNKGLCEEFKVQSYPTLLHFKYGKLQGPYSGTRNAASFASFVDPSQEL